MTSQTKFHLPDVFSCLVGFLFMTWFIYDSNSRNVDGLRISKSISISSRLESRNDGSRL
jgi:hypothetical protein